MSALTASMGAGGHNVPIVLVDKDQDKYGNLPENVSISRIKNTKIPKTLPIISYTSK